MSKQRTFIGECPVCGREVRVTKTYRDSVAAFVMIPHHTFFPAYSDNLASCEGSNRLNVPGTLRQT